MRLTEGARERLRCFALAHEPSWPQPRSYTYAVLSNYGRLPKYSVKPDVTLVLVPVAVLMVFHPVLPILAVITVERRVPLAPALPLLHHCSTQLYRETSKQMNGCSSSQYAYRGHTPHTRASPAKTSASTKLLINKQCTPRAWALEASCNAGAPSCPARTRAAAWLPYH